MQVRRNLTIFFSIFTEYARNTCAHAIVKQVGARVMLSATLSLGLPTATSADALDMKSTTHTAFAANERTVTASQIFTNGLISGSMTRIAKELVLHPIDTIKTRIQTQRSTPNSTVDNDRNILFKPEIYQNLYAGVLPSVSGGIPAGAVFFSVKDFTKELCKNIILESSLNPDISRAQVQQVSTVAAVVVANVFYWLVRNPFEVLKTRAQVQHRSAAPVQNQAKTTPAASTRTRKSADRSAGEALERRTVGATMSAFWSSNGTSYAANLLYALPADIIKFLSYEALQAWVEGLATATGNAGPGLALGSVALQGAILGALASVVAQVCTTPLDVVRTQLMTNNTIFPGDAPSSSIFPVLQRTATEIFLQEGLVRGLFAGTAPRVVRALASGAVQFATYEVSQRVLLS